MTRRLLATYLTLTAIALAALAIPLGLTFADRERERLYADIERDASVIASLAEDHLEADATPTVDAVLADYKRRTSGRVLIVDRRGVSVADSDAPGAAPRDYSTRPEISSALGGNRTIGTRSSSTLGSDLVFVALPVTSGGEVHGAVRVTFPTSARDARVREVWLRLAELSAVVLALAAVFGLVLARSISRPLELLGRTAEKIANGELTARAPVDRGPPEVRNLAATFNESARRLDQLVGAQRRFVADAAHQLRTPLTAMRLRLENLQANVTPDDQTNVTAVLAEVERLSRIVSGLLLLARQEAEPPTSEPADLGTLVAGRLDAWADVAAQEDVVLARDLPEHLWVRAPSGAIEQILDNLLANAIAVSPPNSTITVAVAARAASAVLTVTDQGAGLSAEDREHAFERFWRRAAGQGTGLGLAIVRELSQSAGGAARLEPGPDGRGITAVVELPPLRRSLTKL